jgi:hypothetical protein
MVATAIAAVTPATVAVVIEPVSVARFRIRMNNETLSVIAVCINNPDRSLVAIYRCHTSRGNCEIHFRQRLKCLNFREPDADVAKWQTQRT